MLVFSEQRYLAVVDWTEEKRKTGLTSITA